MDFLSNLTIGQLFGILAALIGGAVALWKGVDFIIDKIRGHFDKHYHSKKEQNDILERLAEQEEKHERNDASILQLAENIKGWQASIEEKLKDHDKKIDLLIEDSRNNNKSWLVQQYHYFTEVKGYIDDFSLDSAEQRFHSYIAEGGNSYVELLMNELRKLPKHPKEG
jgi:hypothetical protein